MVFIGECNRIEPNSERMVFHGMDPKSISERVAADDRAVADFSDKGYPDGEPVYIECDRSAGYRFRYVVGCFYYSANHRFVGQIQNTVKEKQDGHGT